MSHGKHHFTTHAGVKLPIILAQDPLHPVDHIADNTALGRLGEAEDIGVFVAGMLSDDSRFLNAQRIELSGGIMI